MVPGGGGPRGRAGTGEGEFLRPHQAGRTRSITSYRARGHESFGGVTGGAAQSAARLSLIAYSLISLIRLSLISPIRLFRLIRCSPLAGHLAACLSGAIPLEVRAQMKGLQVGGGLFSTRRSTSI